MEFNTYCTILCLIGTFSLSVSTDHLEEGHSILKRFAGTEREFTSHEVAQVLHEREQDSFHRISRRDLRSISSDDNERRLRLDLSSGSSLHLRLKKRSLFGEDTQFYDNTEKGVFKREAPSQDCYASGSVEVNGSHDGVASVALCDGLHGTATSNGVEYYIHPVTDDEFHHRVHVLTRRATEYAEDAKDKIAVIDNLDLSGERFKRDVSDDTYKTATSFVIEMAIFVDAHYYAILQRIAPGREDEYVLITMTAVQALYGDKEKVGYDAKIKIKLYMNWIEDPDEYKFEEDIFVNMKSFCAYTRELYKYDMHYLFTGIAHGHTVGVAWVGGVCTRARCGVSYPTTWNNYKVVAHEMGHLLGFNHHGGSECPEEIKELSGGFMGGVNQVNFSPCNKWELQKFFSRGKGKCLFEETAIVNTTDEYVNLPRVLPGQNGSPDEQCRIRAGNDFEYFNPFDLAGKGVCAVFMCINLNATSPDYLRVVKVHTTRGFPCGDEMLCYSKNSCESWDYPWIGWDVAYLRGLKENVSWSEWSENWSECSSECGTGVQTKRRRCIYKEGLNVSPNCRGISVKARPCNQNECLNYNISDSAIRVARGDEVCQRFLENNVTLKVSEGARYLPTSKQAWVQDFSNVFFATKSCMLTCERDPAQWNHVDAIFPDGTPCTESDKSPYTRHRFDIELRCVSGVCTEISDCPENKRKNHCGECGSDSSRCIKKVIDSAYDVPPDERVILCFLPAGTKQIEVSMKDGINPGVRLEVWTAEDEKILGAGGLFPDTSYRGQNLVEYAGTTWEYAHDGLILAEGPIDSDLVIRALRQEYQIKLIDVIYLLPEDDDGIS